MSPFESELKTSTPELISTFGQTAFVRGVEMLTILAEEEYEDETGFKRVFTASFDKKYYSFISVGDEMVISGDPYVIAKLPRENTLDQFFTVELKRA